MKVKTVKRVCAAILAGLMAAMVIIPSLSLLIRAEDDVVFVTEEDLAEDDGDSDTAGAAGSNKPDVSSEQNQLSQLGDRYENLQNEKKKLDAAISQTKNEKDKKVAVMQQIDGQIGITTEQINILSERIALLEDHISQKEAEIREKQGEIDDNYELFKGRFTAMTKTPRTSTVGLVLGAQSFAQFVTRTQVTSRVADYDQQMLAELTRQKQELNKMKAELEENMQEIEEGKAEMDAKKQELDTQYVEAKKQVQDIALQEQQYLANKAQIDAEMKKVQSQMDLIYAEIARKSTRQVYVGGSMSQPTPTLNQVTSTYGPRFGGSDFHTGIDFSGPSAYGQQVVAANTGTVAKVNTAYTNGYSGGYGIYVIVDHGGGITTLYAHCSKILVNEGDIVTRGQPIAAVGNTGWSTGPHTHFEVRVNGKHTNPVPYLTGK